MCLATLQDCFPVLSQLSDHVQNKKCGNVSGVSKVVEEKKKEKAPKAAGDQSRTRKFSTKWQVCRSWLKNDEEKGMTCKWCVANKRTDCSECFKLDQIYRWPY